MVSQRRERGLTILTSSSLIFSFHLPLSSPSFHSPLAPFTRPSPSSYCSCQSLVQMYNGRFSSHFTSCTCVYACIRTCSQGFEIVRHESFSMFCRTFQLKCCKSTCDVVNVYDLLVCSHCLGKAFSQHYSMIKAIW